MLEGIPELAKGIAKGSEWKAIAPRIAEWEWTSEEGIRSPWVGCESL